MSRKLFLILIIAAGSSLPVAPVTIAQPQPFYQGKTIRIVVGFTPGGFYDRWARLIARYMPKYIPGNPEMIIQNMPGASSVIAANYVYNVAKGDGLTLLVPINSLYLDQLVERKEVQFDMRKFEWIGSQEKTPILLYFRADSPFKTVADIIKASEPPKCGATGTASTGYLLAKLMEENLKAKLHTVTGYPGGSEIDVAVERGEIICRGMDIPPHFGREPFDTWHKNGFDRHILQGGPKRDPRLADTPTLFELMDQYKTPDVGRRLSRVILAAGDFGRPMVAAPATPGDRVKMLREAYAKAMKDPELIAEANKGKMDMDPSTGEDLQALLKEIMDQPRAVVDQVKKILAS
ncbi:MAG TPA: tripartite tricarboxylate transporter substrate-binding protein [Candidatus Binatia bacterium]|jgi:tripartite-type tricarboxylate transporter receptor subunit TctC